ncbi:NAD synthetase [hydrothermal vent metagenome]|uniref:NAD synthetase n=1 Tax=hydrothermal vent metagenome TaxID=652676 RepID=A0A3B0YCB2_9ZZZZ
MSALSPDVLNFDMDAEVDRVGERLREILRSNLNRRGLIIAMSGGIDSSVCAGLAVKALGPKKVYGLLLPETDSSSDSKSRGQLLAEHLGIEFVLEDIAPALEAIGCYRWRDDAIRSVFPEYGEGWKNKIVISGGTEGLVNHFQLVVQTPDGELKQQRLPLREYLQIVAATNYKQRLRKSIEYFHADRLNYAVIGTPNRLEYDQGFFVKNGDGSADVKPIAHLYKSQVYALARHMGLPEEICSAIPTTDTYSLQQGQDEFYFALPYAKMDLALWALNHGHSASELAEVLDVDEKHAEFIYKDIKNKRKATHYMHAAPVLVEDVAEIIK